MNFRVTNQHRKKFKKLREVITRILDQYLETLNKNRFLFVESLFRWEDYKTRNMIFDNYEYLDAAEVE